MMMAGIKTLATLFLMVNTFLLHNVEANDKTNGLDKNGANVCTYVETISKKMNETYLSQRFQHITSKRVIGLVAKI